MIKIKLTIIILLLSVEFTQAQDSIPEYSTFMKELNSGNLDIDYRQFRISYIYSNIFKTKGASEYDDLKQNVYKHIRKKKYSKVLNACQKMLEIDYTSMFAHKYIQQTSKITGDSIFIQKASSYRIRIIKVHSS